jgi:hypothetical protein
LAFAHSPEKEILVEGEANLGDKGRYHPSVAAQIVQGKFGMHLPYYRLQDLFGSSGWTPSRSTLDYLTELVHETTQELPKLMLSQIKKGRCLGLDDTQVKLIMPKELPDNSRCGGTRVSTQARRMTSLTFEYRAIAMAPMRS